MFLAPVEQNRIIPLLNQIFQATVDDMRNKNAFKGRVPQFFHDHITF